VTVILSIRVTAYIFPEDGKLLIGVSDREVNPSIS
jgi:hypothetical protein